MSGNLGEIGGNLGENRKGSGKFGSLRRTYALTYALTYAQFADLTQSYALTYAILRTLTHLLTYLLCALTYVHTYALTRLLAHSYVVLAAVPKSSGDAGLTHSYALLRTLTRYWRFQHQAATLVAAEPQYPLTKVQPHHSSAATVVQLEWGRPPCGAGPALVGRHVLHAGPSQGPQRVAVNQYSHSTVTVRSQYSRSAVTVQSQCGRSVAHTCARR
eukprot:1194309-Prorocentrum_minimum.AAC.4